MTYFIIEVNFSNIIINSERYIWKILIDHAQPLDGHPEGHSIVESCTFLCVKNKEFMVENNNPIH